MDKTPLIQVAADDPAVLSRRERKKRNQKYMIIQAAQPLFERQGYDETTVSEIAEAADISYATFFNYFPAKDDILFAIAHGEYEDLAEVINLRYTKEDPIEEVLRGAHKEWVTDSLKNRNISVRIDEMVMRAGRKDLQSKIHDLWCDLVRMGMERGEFREDSDPDLIVHLLEGLRYQIFLTNKPEMFDPAFDAILSLIKK